MKLDIRPIYFIIFIVYIAYNGDVERDVPE